MPKKNIKKDLNDLKVYRKFVSFKFDLHVYCLRQGLNTKNYSNHMIREYFSNGLSIYDTYKELLSDIPEKE